jgi:hypothetical protein
MSRTIASRLGVVPATALALAALLATLGAPAVAADEIHVTLGPGPGDISHPDLTVEVGDVIVYNKLTSPLPFHILEHLELLPELTYQQNRTRCQAAYTNFEIECHWMDIILTTPPATTVIGIPGNPPAGNGLFYGVTITPDPYTFRWDTGTWHDQMVVGYFGKAALTAPRTFIFVDAVNSQQITHRVTIAPDGWFDPPTLSLPGPISVDATSPDGAVVAFVATATGYGGAAVPVTCVPSSGSTFPIGTTTVDCSATGNGEVTGEGSFDVHVRGAAEQLADLSAASADVGPGKSLVNKIELIQAALAAGAIEEACADLQLGYANAVAAQAGKKIEAATAAGLLEAAAAIAAVIGCPADAGDGAAGSAPSGGAVFVFPTLLAWLANAFLRRTRRSAAGA